MLSMSMSMLYFYIFPRWAKKVKPCQDKEERFILYWITATSVATSISSNTTQTIWYQYTITVV